MKNKVLAVNSFISADYGKGLNDIKCVQYVVLAWDRPVAVYYVLK